ncbi:MAG: hypothetical protein JWN66_4704 [Sphingomonas bacterium]|uniref:SPOR domain-containing protein n=1 Tax=Sphingomonas bacterium TaxID=1895847 RepID=UPI002615CEB9|nr:SPOR domain-containing protein [Sphingomonas bacterium]MDB5707588.1 hypothetical protein [Sphingomonas bacterium]
MKTRAVLTLGLTALVACGAVAGVASHGGMAFASDRSESRAERQAVAEAAKAQKALAKGNVTQAISHAEAAVALRPQVAQFRVLLGTSYLKAGRFGSARQSYADVLSLEPGNGKAALNLALAQIATGDWGGARKTLDAHTDSIPVSDRGLAMALAGDPVGAIAVLDAAVRSPEADAKTRQNLALSFALAGRWQEAKTMVAVDVAPAEVDHRIMQWASFARPKSAYDQVASLLGVTPVLDQGQPVALALNSSSGPALAVADPVEAFMPGQAEPAVLAAQDLAPPAPAPEADVAVTAAPVEVASAPAPSFSTVVFGPREEVVQRLPSNSVRAASRPAVRAVAQPTVRMASAAVSPRTPGKGNFFVQLGAFQNAAVAKDAWGRAVRSNASFAGQTPSGMSISSKAGTFYRLSVGGFARGDADALCNAYKAKGGICFVRAHAGDQVALWARPGRQLASR